MAQSHSNLFVVGAARSGTTILQASLNSSPDVFLFGEANFYLDPGTRDFRQRYNAMHASYGNQPTKGTFCPALLQDQATCYDYLSRLSESYRLVGDKLAFSEPFGHSTDAFMAFQARHFYDAHHIFTFRNPVDCLSSAQRKFRPDDLAPFARSYLRVVMLYLTMLRTFPRVTAVVMEDIDRQTFQRLSQWLACDLSRAYAYYSNGRISRSTPASVTLGEPSVLERMTSLYETLRAATPPENLPLYIEQKTSDENAAQQTALGGLATEASALIAILSSSPAAVRGER